MPIVVMGAGLPAVIREDETQAPVVSGDGLLVFDGTEPAEECPILKPEPVRKRRRSGSAES